MQTMQTFRAVVVAAARRVVVAAPLAAVVVVAGSQHKQVNSFWLAAVGESQH